MSDIVNRLLLALGVTGCWTGAAPPPKVEPPPPVAAPARHASPGYLTIAAASTTFERGVRLADKGDLMSALIELSKVVDGYTADDDLVRSLAHYNIGTVALELGWFTYAEAVYAELDHLPIASAVRERIVAAREVLARLIGRGGDGDSRATGRHLARFHHELKLLTESDRAFQATQVAANVLQELTAQISVAKQLCEQLGCPKVAYIAPPPLRPTGVTSL